MTGAPFEFLHPFDDGVVALDGYVCAQAPEFRHMHEAVLEIVSVITLEPRATAMRAMIWACRSVGNPGYGRVSRRRC